MRAIAITAYGGPDKLELLDLPVPDIGPKDVLVSVRAAGVNLVDTMFRSGYMGKNVFPLVMGSDFAGRVEKVGAEVQGIAPGDDVFGYKLMGNGTYAEFAAVPAAYLTKMPKSLDYTRAAAIPCAGLTAYEALTEVANVRAGETLLVTAAAGGVGAFAVQIAAALGARVIATASEKNHDFLRSLGAAEVIDYRKDDWVGAVRKAVPQGVDACLTCIAGETKQQCVGAVRDGGRLVWISGEEPLGPPMQRMISGAYSWGRPDPRVLDALAALSDQGKLTVPVEDVVPLRDASKAHERVDAGHGRGKLVIDIQ